VIYLLKRIGFAVATIFVATTLNFFLFRVLPGDAVRNLARVPHATPELKASLERQFGLDKSPFEQYLLYLRELLRGNMGVSFTDQRPVADNLREALWNTVPMVLTGTVIAVLLGILTGVIAAWWRGSWRGSSGTSLAIFFYAVPTQWLALVLLIWFSGALPSHGMRDPYLLDPSAGAQMVDVIRHMVLPAATLALTLYGEYALITRSAMLETLGEDYVLTARAKGLMPWRIVRDYALRNAMLPVSTLIALSLGYVVAGAILIETVFSWPGIGYAAYQAVVQRDYPMLQGTFLVLTVSVVAFNLLADLLYVRLDPRIRE
jgi:peptide/nickel transport system permease protein